MTNKKFLFLIGLTGLFGTSHAQDSWSLQDCIDYALQNNI